jgi:hypothetical protein
MLELSTGRVHPSPYEFRARAFTSYAQLVHIVILQAVNDMQQFCSTYAATDVSAEHASDNSHVLQILELGVADSPSSAS